MSSLKSADNATGDHAQGRQACLFVELDASTFMNNFAGGAGGAVASTSASLPIELRCDPHEEHRIPPPHCLRWRSHKRAPVTVHDVEHRRTYDLSPPAALACHI